MTTLRIEITAEDIAGAERESAENCPIARAMQRTMSEESWECDLSTVYRWPWCDPTYELPEVVKAAARQFNDTGYMEPITFDLVLFDV